MLTVRHVPVSPLDLTQTRRWLTNQALVLKSKCQNGDSDEQCLPEFEVVDDTYVETRESHSRLEQEMILKAFSESGIHAAL